LKWFVSVFYKDASPDGLSKNFAALRVLRASAFIPAFPHTPGEAFSGVWKFAQNNYLNPAENRILISALKHHNEPK
jgi:hypothetical protein